MRTRGILAVLVTGLLAAAPAAAAPTERFVSTDLAVHGSLKLKWHAARSRGCAQAGLCGYSGTIAYPPSATGLLYRFVLHDRVESVGGFIDMNGHAVARTLRERPGAAPAVCRQRYEPFGLTLDTERGYGGRRWLSAGTDISPSSAASGQCAGPRTDDFTPSLPSVQIRPRQLDRRGTHVSLAGRFPWRSGPLVGELVSTLRLISRGTKTHRVHGQTGNQRGGRHTVYVDLQFTARRLEGEVRTDFRAVDAPICHVRDACGTRGSEVYSLEAAGQRVDVVGSVRTRSRRRPSLHRALRMILRHGTFSSAVDLRRSTGISTHQFVRPGEPTCTDRFRPSAPFIELFGLRRTEGVSMFGAPSGLLRGHCPGPSDDDTGSERLALARLAKGALARRTVAVDLAGRHKFVAGAYRGTRTVRVALRLRRKHARVAVDHIPGRHGRYIIFEFSTISSGGRRAR